MKFKMGYKLGFDLNKVEDLKDKVLNFFGFNEKEVKNILIDTNDNYWYYCTFEADEKSIKTDNGIVKLDYINKKIIVNNKTLKIEENTDFAIKTLKTKIKTTTMQDLTRLLAEDLLYTERLCKMYQ